MVERVAKKWELRGVEEREEILRNIPLGRPAQPEEIAAVPRRADRHVGVKAGMALRGRNEDGTA